MALMVLRVTFNVLNKNEKFISYVDTYICDAIWTKSLYTLSIFSKRT